MAARAWRSIVALAVAASALAAAGLARSFAWSLSTALAVTLLLLAALPVAATLATFIIALTVSGRLHARSGMRIGRALCGEIAAFCLSVLAMITNAPERPQQQPRSAGGIAQPVLLLHGFFCNHRVWRLLQARLNSAGYGPVEAIDVEPLLADIDAQASRVANRLVELQQECNGARVVIIAHSMGGLVARALLRQLGATAIRRIVTIASPHHGTALALCLPWTDARQMSRRSTWLNALNSAQEGRFAVPITSIYSLEDNLVVPAESARLQGAELHELRGIGHLGMLRSHYVLDRVLATLS
jgi:pimeloyl-ACP methyl ester carboxylesterase